MKYSSIQNQIVIPDKVEVYGKKYPVTSIKAGAFQRARAGSSVMKIKIGKNVQSIGKNAFADNPFVQNITINSKKLKAKSVGKNAFQYTGRIYAYVKVKVPAGKKAAYRKILEKAGLAGRLRVS